MFFAESDFAVATEGLFILFLVESRNNTNAAGVKYLELFIWQKFGNAGNKYIESVYDGGTCFSLVTNGLSFLMKGILKLAYDTYIVDVL